MESEVAQRLRKKLEQRKRDAEAEAQAEAQERAKTERMWARGKAAYERLFGGGEEARFMEDLDALAVTLRGGEVLRAWVVHGRDGADGAGGYDEARELYVMLRRAASSLSVADQMALNAYLYRIAFDARSLAPRFRLEQTGGSVSAVLVGSQRQRVPLDAQEHSRTRRAVAVLNARLREDVPVVVVLATLADGDDDESSLALRAEMVREVIARYRRQFCFFSFRERAGGDDDFWCTRLRMHRGDLPAAGGFVYYHHVELSEPGVVREHMRALRSVVRGDYALPAYLAELGLC